MAGDLVARHCDNERVAKFEYTVAADANLTLGDALRQIADHIDTVPNVLFLDQLKYDWRDVDDLDRFTLILALDPRAG